MITFKHKGDFSKSRRFFSRILDAVNLGDLDKYGKMGVDALAASTPKDTENTANSWRYEVLRTDNSVTIRWFNTNENKGVNIALILQYGHGTRNGGYVKGRDYINPAMQPIFDEIAETAWKEITRR